MRHPRDTARPAGVLVAVGLALAWSSPTPAAESQLFRQFVAARESGMPSKLPDYSYAGYHRCEKPLPEVSPRTHKALNVADFGAVPDDGRSDRDAFLKALAAAHAHAGPVLLSVPAGRFRLQEPSDLGKPPLVIKRGGIVLKGAGVGSTELYFDQPMLLGRSHLTVISDRPKDYYWRGGTKVARVTSAPKRGGFVLEVDDASKLKPGMFVNLDADLNVNTAAGKAFFAPHEIPEGPKRGRSKPGVTDYMFELHQVNRIEGNRVTFGEPIHLELNHMESVVLWSVDHTVQEVGIEDLSLTGNFRQQFKHHNGSRFGESFRLVRFEDAVNCWMRNVRFCNYSMAIEFRRSAFNTFMNLLMEGNPGHSLVTGSMSYGNLFAYVREQTDTHHGLGVRQGATNSVFLRCVQHGSLEAHCGYARASLYDLNEGGFRPRGGGATFTPHHGKLLCFWNWNVTEPGSFDFWPKGQRYGYFMPPIIAGLHGEPFEIPDQDTDLAAMESPGEPVTPESLFEAQLALRLGKLPTWLTEESRLFEEISRHSRIEIESPADHSIVPVGQPVTVRFRVPPEVQPKHLRQLQLLVGHDELVEGFAEMARLDHDFTSATFTPRRSEPLLLRARMTNVRGEVCTSDPVTLFVGDPSALRPVSVQRAGMLPRPDKGDLYSQFVAEGGAEAGALKNSKALARRETEGKETWEIEKDYLAELQTFYRRFGREHVAPLLEKPANLALARRLIDGNEETACPSLYHYIDTMAQFDFGAPKEICRLDLHWKNGNPGKPVRLELQVSNDPDAWYSVVNDEPLWEFSVLRVGSTLEKAMLPGDKVTTLYFPTRRCRYVRLLFGSFPNELAEVRFLGPAAE